MVTKPDVAQCILVHPVHFVRLNVFGTHRGRNTIEVHSDFVVFLFGKIEIVLVPDRPGPGASAAVFVMVEFLCGWPR